MSVRETILARVRAATDPLPDKTTLPSVEDVLKMQPLLVPESEDLDTWVSLFSARWKAASGILVESVEELRAFLATEQEGLGYVDPLVLEALELESFSGAQTTFPREQVDEFSFAVTRAKMGIVETGTIVLADRSTSVRLAALAPWTHVAVLRKSELVPSVSQAIAAFDDDPSIVFVTGPSKTADIEGILIEGVHGPGRQVCLLL